MRVVADPDVDVPVYELKEFPNISLLIRLRQVLFVHSRHLLFELQEGLESSEIRLLPFQETWFVF